ncbi:MAG: hypothetical protein H7Z42_02370, partial [Roseiflexaceae bacterium]|nr:hypothetical protein [Roseiflexaceae bacterium]
MPAMLLGDLNIDGLRDAQNDPNSDYSYLANQLRFASGHALHDIGGHLAIGTNIDSDGNQTRRIDHMFVDPSALRALAADVIVERF